MITWTDSGGTGSSIESGVVISAQRAADLVWEVDSATAKTYLDTPNFTGRPLGDFALLLLIGHEVAHLALDADSSVADQPQAIKECAADILAGFQLAVVAPRMAPGTWLALTSADVTGLLGRLLTPGDWIAGASHPDDEQRGACLTRGYDIFADQSGRASLGDNVIPDDAIDSVYEDLSLGKTNMLVAGVIVARSILSMPGESRTPAVMLFDRYAASASELLRFVDSTLDRVDSSSAISGVMGEPVSLGITLFPWDDLHEMTHSLPYPWKCAVTSASSQTARAVACYVIGNSTAADVLGLEFGEQLQIGKTQEGYRVTPVTGSRPRDAALHLRQWLLDKPPRRVLVSEYDEPHLSGEFRKSYDGRRTIWIAIEAIPIGRQQ